ncbi:MAG TPA: DUF190 domain-containing protein [Actinobacteria bacterium]|nr:DUF190 domain-containing protein [Actinomycetes bacterium]HEX21279.1 DUF190 domain-containing protein [Actinomycetota bacterium]
MQLTGEGRILSIYIGESDHWHHRPLYQAIVELANKEGLAGATVIRGIEGFGARSRIIKTATILRLSEDLPIIIEIVDKSERIDKFLLLLDDMVNEGLVTIENVQIIKYAHGDSVS